MSGKPAAALAVQGPQRFAERLIAWQREHGRHDLPWQASSDPYRVWLSEIMLQQTQVGVVVAYYARFLQRFPSVRELAAASLDEVLALWSGLGYYRRARHLHQCAQQVCALHGGEFPRTAEALRQLAGIGRSTAAAIAAFCHSERAAILDGNVKRVLSRAYAMPQLTSEAAAQRALWCLAEALVPERDVAAYTQGLMDLGATVCKPRHPACGQCPFGDDCQARKAGQPEGAGGADTMEARPLAAARRKPAAPRRTQRWVLLWAEDARAAAPSIWLERRGAAGIWPGLWCLPQFDTHEQALHHAGLLGIVRNHDALASSTHALTHLDLQLSPLRVRLDPRPAVHEDGGAWFPLRAALELGLPAPVRRLLQGHGHGSDAAIAPVSMQL